MSSRKWPGVHRRRLLVACLLALGRSGAKADVISVSAGLDTISSVISAGIKSGDKLELADGNYTSDQNFFAEFKSDTCEGSVCAGVTIRAANRGKAILDGRWRGSGKGIRCREGVLTVDGLVLERFSSQATKLDKGEITLTHMEYRDLYGSAAIKHEGGTMTIRSSWFHHNNVGTDAVIRLDCDLDCVNDPTRAAPTVHITDSHFHDNFGMCLKVATRVVATIKRSIFERNAGYSAGERKRAPNPRPRIRCLLLSLFRACER